MYHVIIVEDEDVIRQGIKSLIDWEGMDCQVVWECGHGKEALAYLKDHPVDIVVTDIKMPEMDGIELLKEMSQREYTAKVIILTAFSQFSYAQQALRYGAEDFIVKNDFMNELPKAVKSVITQLEEERKGHEQGNHLDESEVKALIDYLLGAMMRNEIIDDSHPIEKYGLDQYYYATLYCEMVDEDKVLEGSQLIKATEEIIETSFKEYHYHHIGANERHQLFLLSQPIDKGIIQRDKLQHGCEKVIETVTMLMQIGLKFGISRGDFTLDQLGASLKEAENALGLCLGSGSQVVQYVDSHQANGYKSGSEEAIVKMVEALFSQQYKQVEEELEKWIVHLYETHTVMETCRLQANQLRQKIVTRLWSIEENQGVKDMDSSVKLDMEESLSLYTLKRACYQLIKKTQTILENKQNVKSYLVKAINQYIKRHYKENISLDAMSEELHISKSYLSRVYKKKTGKTLTDAINGYRIKKGKELLKSNQYKIYEVSELIGYEDPAYFTNKFKQYVGCSPKDYRNAHG